MKDIEKSAAALEAAGFERLFYGDGSFVFDDKTRQCDISFMRCCSGVGG